MTESFSRIEKLQKEENGSNLIECLDILNNLTSLQEGLLTRAMKLEQPVISEEEKCSPVLKNLYLLERKELGNEN